MALLLGIWTGLGGDLVFRMLGVLAILAGILYLGFLFWRALD